MCGIAGIFNLKYDDSTIHNMINTMKKRGPDEEGIYCKEDICLLHRRLAVIDPENGKQPIHLTTENEIYSMVYNGELYNTDELRQALISLGHQFKSHADTEVLIHAYAQWSDQCLDHLNGIYAFAVWEHNRGRLFLARDRMGVKPLFYGLKHNGIVFGSELKTILKHPDFSPIVSREGIANILLLGPGRTPGCGIYKNIYELKPGHYAYFDSSLKTQQYWKLRDREHSETFENTAAYVRYLVTDSIERQTVSDVPLGTFLSGGLDSSIISSVCAQNNKSKGEILPTFSVGYQDNEKYFIPGKFQPNADDIYIQLMAETIGSYHHNTLLTPDTLFHSLTDAVLARDLPGMADVDSSLLAFCKEIRKHVTVALSGECADEIFGGYPWYTDPQIRSAEGFPWSQNASYRASFIHEGLFDQDTLNNFVHDKYRDTIAQCDIRPDTDPQERRMKEMTNLNIVWFMQTLLDRKDRMSMYNSLEVRVPFCDHRIAEYLYSVPWSYKYYNGQEKGLLRYAMQDCLPDAVLNRKKSPYPKTHDPKYYELVKSQLHLLIQNKKEPIHQLLKADKLSELLETESQWPWYGQLMRTPQTIAYMLQLNTWLTLYNVDIDI